MARQLYHTGLICINLIYALTVNAQTETKRSSLTGFGVGARGSVLKATYVSIADDYSATHWNPAGISFINGISFGGMYFQMPFNREINFVSFILPVGRQAKLGFSWEGFLINNIPARRENTIAPDYYFSNIEEAIWLTYSQRINSPLSLGFNLKYLHQKLDETDARGWGMDASLMLAIHPKIKLGFVIYDIGSQLKWSTRHIDYFKKLNRLGISYQVKPDLLLSLALEGNYQQFNQLALGTEFKLTEPVYIRMGWQNNKFALGMGLTFSFENIKLQSNYAISNSKISGQLSHTYGLSISFWGPSVSKPQFVTIKCAALNVRTGPGIKNKKIAVVYKGQKFILVDKKSKWLKIEYTKSKTGWIRSSYAEVVNS